MSASSIRVLVTAFALLLSVIVMSGCSPEPKPVETDDPVTEAFEAVDDYLAVLAEVGHDGGIDPERLDAVVAGAARDEAIRAAASWVELGIRIEGTQSLFRVESRVDGDTAEVIGCRDTSEWIFRQSDGAQAQTSEGGPEYLTTYTLARVEDGTWRVVTQSSEPGCPDYPIE